MAVVVISCGGGGNENGDDTPSPPCSDGVDNDGDGAIDFPEDLGCTSPLDDTEDSPTMPRCSDGRDNDGDGKIDYPKDPGCFNPASDDEIDDCPDGPACPQCGNGKDDDMNGSTDFPDDAACESAADGSEYIDNPFACGTGMKIKQLPANGVDMGTLDGSSISQLSSECGGGGGSSAVAYIFNLPEPKVLVATTDDAGTEADTVLDIRRFDCDAADATLGCADDIDANNEHSTLTKSLLAGTYYLIVSGQNSAESGAYHLQVDLFAGQGAECADQTECGPGLICRTPVGGVLQVCSQPVCNDGLDDDGDGKIDYPNDPGCNSPTGSSETDDCPNGPNCPECANGVDDDGDTTTDYPGDLTCKAAGDASEACVTSEGVELLVAATTTGTTTGAVHDIRPSCGSATSNAPERTYRVDLPATTTLTFNTTGINTVTELRNATCTGTAVACSDPPAMTVTNLAAGTYYFLVDGATTTTVGAYTINLTGKIANDASCEGTLAQAGALTCADGFACKGTAGARTCRLAQCNDTLDNNGDGRTDYPADPGCQSRSDDAETTVCPGANCPVCSNGLDDDGDTRIDYPLDTSCVAASGTSETCTATEGVGELTMPTTAGDTTTATDDVKLTCSSTTATAKDLHYQMRLPQLSTLKLTLTSSFDAATAVFNSTCGGTALTCSDPNAITMANVAAGTYFYVVDGFSTGSGTFSVKVEGSIVAGGSCELPLAQSGALTCPQNYACKGAAGARTCQVAACADGVDNNGDGKIDFPFDPGCSSPTDDTEDTVCPGASCPVCSNAMDDDADTLTDFPADFGCASAGGTTEVFCTGEPDVGGAITMPVTTGTLAGRADNYDQTCQSNTGNDMAFGLQLPVPVASLQIDTIGSAISDSVLSVKDASCGTQLACNDDGAGLLSKIVLTNVSPGNYAIQVDGYSASNNGAFTLNVKGTVAAQTVCTSPLFTSGVLVCPVGTTCVAATGKCQ
ncbi:MAG: hypothetical protein ABI867_18410 [Kofleriaceae bacterium]